MGRHAATCVLVVAACTVAFAQTVPVSKEPHHRIVYEDANLRVLDVNIAPGGMTLEHSHDLDIATVSIGPADARIRPAGADWGSPRRRPLGHTNTADYVGMPGSHTIENVSSDHYRLLAVENTRTSGWRAVAGFLAPGVSVAAESRAFRANVLMLEDGGRHITRRPDLPAVVVLATGKASLTTNGHEALALGWARPWAVVHAGESYTVTAGNGDAQLVEIVVR